jgi:DNA-binding NarL/FixJ family response regulator
MPLTQHVANLALDQLESDVVIQAVGRVRPFTRPRLVVTFQASDLPAVGTVRDFNNLAEARNHFGLPTPCAGAMASRAERVRSRKAQGLTIAEIAAEIGVGESTVKQDLKAGQKASVSI